MKIIVVAHSSNSFKGLSSQSTATGAAAVPCWVQKKSRGLLCNEMPWSSMMVSSIRFCSSLCRIGNETVAIRPDLYPARWIRCSVGIHCWLSHLKSATNSAWADAIPERFCTETNQDVCKQVQLWEVLFCFRSGRTRHFKFNQHWQQ